MMKPSVMPSKPGNMAPRLIASAAAAATCSRQRFGAKRCAT